MAALNGNNALKNAPLYDQTVTFTHGGLGLGFGFTGGGSSNGGGGNGGGEVESQTTRIGGEKRRVESLNVERATGLGGDFIDVEEEEYEDEDKEQHLMTMKKREENEREEEKRKERDLLAGKREGNVGNDNDDRNNDRNKNDNSSGEDPLWSPRGTAQRLRNLKSPLVRLHGEIVDFCRFLEPTEEEEKSRLAAVERVREAVMTIWPSSRFEVHGSFATKMYLPSSDVDAVILDSGAKSPAVCLKALALYLARRGEATNIQLISKARVPIVKFEETKSGVQFDVSFDVANGPASAEIVKRNTRRFPALRPLTTVLKCFLSQRGLNEVYSGGIGSYALLCMIMTFLQLRESIEASEWAGERGREDASEGCLGTLLIDFFELYGRKLNAEEIGISCGDADKTTSTNRFFVKSEKNFYDERRPFLLSIQDPQDPENDLGRNSYAWRSVKAAFEHAFTVITAPVGASKEIFLLGRIVKMDTEMMKHRAAPKETGAIRGVFSDFQNFVEANKERRAGVTPRQNASKKKKQGGVAKAQPKTKDVAAEDPTNEKKRGRWEKNDSSSSEEEEGALEMKGTMIANKKRKSSKDPNAPLFEVISVDSSSSSSSSEEEEKNLEDAMNAYSEDAEEEEDDDDDDRGGANPPRKQQQPKKRKYAKKKSTTKSRGRGSGGRGGGRGGRGGRGGYFSNKRTSS